MQNNFIQVIKTNSSADERGSFKKLFDRELQLFLDFEIKQINQVTNSHKFTLRGLHYQIEPFNEAKCFRVLKGKVFLVCVNINELSAQYLSYDSVILDDGRFAAFIPQQFAAGYCTLENNTELIYFSNNIYKPECEKGILWSDPSIGINWPTDTPILSPKDELWSLVKPIRKTKNRI